MTGTGGAGDGREDLPAAATRTVSATDRRWHARGESTLLLPFALWCVDRLRRPIGWCGVDYSSLRDIVRVKLLLDLRGIPLGAGLGGDAGAQGGAAGSGRRSEGFLTLGFALLLSAAWLAGMPAGVLGALRIPAWAWMAAVSATAMGMLGFLVFMQASMWVMDTTDLGVIASRPVSDRTLFAARLVHTLVYVGLLSACLMFWPLALGSISYPWWAVLTMVPLCVALSALLAVGGVSGLFVIALRLVGPARFQRVTLWVQIGVSMLLMGGVQIIVPLLQSGDGLRQHARDLWLRALLPPLHYGGLFECVLGDRSGANLILAALALCMPLAVLVIGLLLASRHFIAGLSGELRLRAASSARWPDGPLVRLGRALTRTDAERAGYGFTLAMARRDRLFVRGAWPMLGGLLLMSVAMVLPLRRHVESYKELVGWQPFALYALSIVIPGVLEIARCSEHWPARWIFSALPVADPRQVLRGGVLALLFGTLAPVLLVASAALLLLSGPAALPDVLLALALNVLLTLHVARLMELHLPFTQPAQSNDFQVTNIAVMLGMVLLTGIAAGAHAALRLFVPYGACVGVLLAAPLVVRAWRGLDQVQLLDPATGRVARPGRSADAALNARHPAR